MSETNNTYGIFTISLDLELYWGMRDVIDIKDYAKNLEGVEDAVTALLQLFKQYGIHATWAPVGFLFFPDLVSLNNNLPPIKPSYDNPDYDLYLYLKDINIEKYHFIPNLIKKIATFTHQEIGSHTFSHYYCLEEGQNIDQFRADISSVIAITKKELDKDVKSLIFPRNQWNKEYLSILSEYNIACFRGTENHWIYKASNEKHNTLPKRALRLLDAYFNLTGHHTYTLSKVSTEKPYNIRSSAFLRPVPQSLSLFEKIRLRRILDAMTHAAQVNQVYHLWWHPHNFGSNIKSNIKFLKKILEHYTFLQHKYNMQSLNMREVASLLDTNP